MRLYMEALGASNYSSIKSLFAEDGTVTSVFLRLMPAREFFDRLGGATKSSVITPIEVFLLSGDQQHAVTYFHDDWTVNYGTLTLIYDAYPIRQTAGNNYDSFRQAAPGACGGRSAGFHRCCDLPPIASMA